MLAKPEAGAPKRMQRDIYDRLPAAVQALVDEIESALPFHIDVREKPDGRASYTAEALEGDVAGALIAFDSAVIEAPGGIAALSEMDLVHELLHLRRTFVERVPHLFPKRQTNGSSAASIDNWLEHVVIYKDQLDFCPDMLAALDADLLKFWSDFPSGTTGQTLRFNALTRLMLTRRYCSPHVLVAARAALDKVPVPGVSRAARECLALLGDKRALLRRALAYCEIPTSLFWVRWCEPELSRNRWEDI